MRRRWLVLALLLGACWMGLHWIRRRAFPISATLADPPALAARTVLLITLDSVALERLVPYGCELSTTPRIAELAREGVVFLDHVAHCNGTNSALASIFTGLTPDRHGLLSVKHLGRHRLREDLTTLAERFRGSGYRTFAAVALPQLSAELSGLAQGFERYVEVPPSEGRPFATAEEIFAAARDPLRSLLASEAPCFAWFHFAEPRSGSSEASSPADAAPFLAHHLAAFTATPEIQAALERASSAARSAVEDLQRLLARRRGSPEEEGLRRALYDGDLRAMDRVVGSILELVVQAGRFEQSLIALTAACGEKAEKPQAAASLRVPLILRWPQGSPIGQVEDLTRAVDLFATLAEVFQWRPESNSGESLLAPLRGEPGVPRSAKAFTSDSSACAWLDETYHLSASSLLTEQRWLDRSSGLPVDEAQVPTDVRNSALSDLTAACVPWSCRVEPSCDLDLRLRLDEPGMALANVGGEVLASTSEGASWTEYRLRLAAGKVLEVFTARGPIPLWMDLRAEQGALEDGDVRINGRDLPQEAALYVASVAGAPPCSTATLPRIAVTRAAGSERALRAEIRPALSEDAPLRCWIDSIPPLDGADRVLQLLSEQPLETSGSCGPILIRGSAPLAFELELPAQSQLALSCAAGEEMIPSSDMCFLGRRFSPEGHLSLFLPEWIPSVSEQLYGATLDRQEPRARVEIEVWRGREAPRESEWQPWTKEQAALVRRLPSGE